MAGNTLSASRGAMQEVVCANTCPYRGLYRDTAGHEPDFSGADCAAVKAETGMDGNTIDKLNLCGIAAAVVALAAKENRL